MIQISNVFFDEVSHTSEESIWWLWSRLRSRAKNVHSLTMTMNPDPDNWTLKYAMWYLYPEGHELAGRPDPEKNGKVRYLLRIGGDIVWGDTREELQEKYGYDKSPISFRALFGTIDDNPPLQMSNPSYRQNLEALPTVERERLLYGNWFARPANSSYYKREDLTEIVEVPPDSDFSKIVRAYDFAGTLPHDGNRETDYFASVKMGKLHTGDYVILEVVRTRITFGDWEQHILDNAFRDGNKVEIILPQDPNAAAKAATSLLARSIIEHGYIVRTKRSSMGKLDSFRPFAAAVENGNISLVKGCATDLWNKVYNDNDFFHKELEAFDGKRRGGQHHDDKIPLCRH